MLALNQYAVLKTLLALTKMIKDYRDRLTVVITGYKDEIEEFPVAKPGLKSRFNN